MNKLNAILYLSAFIAAGCAAQSPRQQDVSVDCLSSKVSNQRAFVELKCVSSSIDFEKDINSHEGVELKDKQKWFEVVEGTIPVVISAPHATRPLRNGERRFSDGAGTAALAIAIGQITGATVIYTTYEGPSDPNYYDDNQYKESLDSIIKDLKPKFLLDLHGSHPYRSYDIDLGTMGGESLLGHDELLSDLISHLQAEGVSSISLNRFAASKNHTITKFASLKNVPAIQLEINANWVSPSAGDINAQRYSLLVQALSRFVRETLNNSPNQS
ncbi:hypothetical protein BTA51_22775 [Hahella sp. CCB-MM4]|uniref:hypothetical protein n=1 Tax=Hahella sp. (strain CCB-MM4) TaxID=1926491 RepID=UPI000B9B94CE|nr:hypothetical protein [Hahella sp. CCB-MM4]OZG71195.1 hypothetical protein BTA51_22775 [Hahella sp. CCB-MM4]